MDRDARVAAESQTVQAGPVSIAYNNEFIFIIYGFDTCDSCIRKFQKAQSICIFCPTEAVSDCYSALATATSQTTRTITELQETHKFTALPA
jgi:hypothetical protein